MQKIIIAGVLSVLMVSFTQSTPLKEKEYPLRLQPEMDAFIGKVDEYLSKDRLFDFQFKCMMDEGPCDIIGKFLKPRTAAALLGVCLLCTPLQKEVFDKRFERFQRERPEVFRRLFVKFIEKAGIEVDEDKKKEILGNLKIEETTRNTNLRDTAELEDTPTEIIENAGFKNEEDKKSEILKAEKIEEATKDKLICSRYRGAGRHPKRSNNK